jgi:hypothetical protein
MHLTEWLRHAYNHPDAVIGVDDQDREGHRAIDDVVAGWQLWR